MYVYSQHYESIVPEKSGMNRLSASHDIDNKSFPLKIAMRCQFTIAALWLTPQLTEGRNSVERKSTVPGAIIAGMAGTIAA